MFLNVVYPAFRGAGEVVPCMTYESLVQTRPDAFERLPVNLSLDEIRAMVLDVLG